MAGNSSYVCLPLRGGGHLILKGNIWVLLAKPRNALLYCCVRTTQIDLICFGLQVRFLPRKGVLCVSAFIMTPFGAIQQTLLDLGGRVYCCGCPLSLLEASNGRCSD